MAAPGGHDPKLPVGSGRARCTVCGLYFGSVAGFDKHRTGEPDARRCMTEAQMRAKGMVVNDKGFWVTEAYDPAAHGRVA
jgi:hypothetical protein